MDNRRLLLVLLIAMPLVILWQPFVTWVYQKAGYTVPERRQIAQTQPATTNPAGTAGTAGAQTISAAGDVEAATQPVIAGSGAFRVVGSDVAAPIVTIGSAQANDPNFSVGVQLNPRGAGIESITLNRFKADVDSQQRYVFQRPYASFEDASRPMRSGVIAGTIGGAPFRIDLSTVHWQVQESSADTTRFAIDIAPAGGEPALRVVKTFHVRNAATDKGRADGYEIDASLQFQNLSAQPVTVSHQWVGPIMPPKELERGSDRNAIGAYVESGRIVRIRHDYLESFSSSKTTIDYSKGSNAEPLLWAGTSSVYFNATLRPDPIGGTTPERMSPDYIAKVEARALDPNNAVAADRKVVTEFQTTDLNIDAGQTVLLPMRLFTGPRMRSLLNNDYLSSLPLAFDHTLVLTSGPCAWCTFQWLVNILVWLLVWIHVVVRDWGLAIIVLVLLVRALLHPITKKSQVNMMKMSKFGPELERIKTKFKDDPQAQQRAIMQFYKEHGATPILGCLPMFLQMPIWIALFSALQSTFELRQAPFLQFGGLKLTWISDLSQPDHLIKIDNPFTILGFITISGLNLLPFLLAIVFWLQHKFTPKPPTMTPEQEQQQKMMQWMTLLFPVFLYGGPSGLNLYILASTTFGIIESKIVRDHVKKKEEEEKQGAVIIDAPPGREPPPKGSVRRKDPPPDDKPKSWLQRKMEEMQKKVDEVQRQAAKQQQKKRRT